MDISSLTPDKQVKFQYWLNIIHECRASGLTNRDWCEQNDISLKSYYYWIAKFRKLALEELPRKAYASSLPVLANQNLPTTPSSAFVEISPVAPDPVPVNNTSPTAILKTGSIAIELYDNTSESFLRMLLKELRQC